MAVIRPRKEASPSKQPRIIFTFQMRRQSVKKPARAWTGASGRRAIVREMHPEGGEHSQQQEHGDQRHGPVIAHRRRRANHQSCDDRRRGTHLKKAVNARERPVCVDSRCRQKRIANRPIDGRRQRDQCPADQEMRMRVPKSAQEANGQQTKKVGND